MTDDERNQSEYTAISTLDDAIYALREFGWSRDDLLERVASVIEDADDD